MSKLTLKHVIKLLHLSDDECVLMQHRYARWDRWAIYMTVAEIRKRLDMKKIIVTRAGLDQSIYGEILGYAFEVLHFKPTECQWGMHVHRIDIT